jgi:leucyl-tRNA synthetase
MLLNDRPMSKSEGNFLTVYEAVEKYSADATRLAIADAGDTLDDGNFRDTVANASIMKLFVLGRWIDEELKKIDLENIDCEKFDETFDKFDKIFENELNYCTENAHQMFKELKFKIALKYGFHDLQIARDEYIQLKKEELNPYLVLRFIELQLLMLTPIAPHFCEHYWQNFFIPAMKKTKNCKDYPELIVNARFPEVTREYNPVTAKIFKFIKY